MIRLMLALHPHSDADVRARAHRLLSITCARLGALDVSLGAEKRQRKTDYASSSTHAADFNKILDDMEKFEQDNAREVANRQSAVQAEHAVADAKLVNERAAADSQLAKERADVEARIAAEKTATDARIATEKAEIDRKFAAREDMYSDKYDEVRRLKELCIVTSGMRKILAHVNGHFDGHLPVSKIDHFLQKTHDDSERERKDVVDTIRNAPIAMSIAHRSAHERTLAVWDALHINEGYFMEKPARPAPSAHLAYRRT